eukprot:TRINITY_DN1274_c0_g1_i2.p1 TRINITY_DN1274_c0_g1~~TRINITY_DN1274_c0_g1_i2.p1  ORF type:complete len:263 (+),score=59.79 TRINITY_DN1274_c0_g1_i2:46-834(+)
MTWEEHRKELQRLEAELDAKLTSFSKFGTKYTNTSLLSANATNTPSFGSQSVGRSQYDNGDDIDIESNSAEVESARLLSDQHLSDSIRYDIEQLLKKLQQQLESASETVFGSASSGSTLARMHLQRHQERLSDFRLQYQKIKKSIQEGRDHAELLSYVREDISQHKNSSRTNLLLRERNSAQNADRALDAVIGQAQAARESLSSQRSMLSGISNKLGTMSRNALPIVRGLISDIRRRKSRDQLILAGTIGICIFLIFLYWIH